MYSMLIITGIYMEYAASLVLCTLACKITRLLESPVQLLFASICFVAKAMEHGYLYTFINFSTVRCRGSLLALEWSTT